jgi:hypothetical protein
MNVITHNLGGKAPLYLRGGRVCNILHGDGGNK